MRLSAMATMASSRDRGFHPSTRSALALVAWRVLSSSGSSVRMAESNKTRPHEVPLAYREGNFVGARLV
jgi:hypothetical protein